MKLKLLSAAATTTIAALISMPGQQAYADECRIENSEGGENDGGAISEDGTALACGDDSRAASNSVALGEGANAGYVELNGNPSVVPITGVGNTTAIGALSSALGNRSTAIGAESQAGQGESSIGIFTGENTVAVGYNARAFEDNSTAIGVSSEVSAVSGTALGANAVVQSGATNAIALGRNSLADVANTLSIGSSGNERRIVNVADGTLSATSTDAVTGAQLLATNELTYFAATGTGLEASVTGNNSLALGVGSVADADNVVSVGSDTLQRRITNLAGPQDATDAATKGYVDSEITTVQSSVGTNAQELTFFAASGTGTASVSGNNSVAIGAGSIADTDNSVSFGSAGNERTLTNVAGGTVAAGSTDAVTGGQLFTTNTNVASAQADATQAVADASTAVTTAAAAHTVANAAQADANANTQELRAFAVNSTAGSAIAGGDQAIAVGMSSVAAGEESVSIGQNSTAFTAETVAIGYESEALGVNSIALGANSVTTSSQANTVSVGNNTLQRRIINVAGPQNATDAATKGYVDGEITTVQSDVAAAQSTADDNAAELVYFATNGSVDVFGASAAGRVLKRLVRLRSVSSPKLWPRMPPPMVRWQKPAVRIRVPLVRTLAPWR